MRGPSPASLAAPVDTDPCAGTAGLLRGASVTTPTLPESASLAMGSRFCSRWGTPSVKASRALCKLPVCKYLVSCRIVNSFELLQRAGVATLRNLWHR